MSHASRGGIFHGDQSAVLAALATYGAKSWHNEPVRVRLAVLKLANGNLQKLQQQLAAADTDYRDGRVSELLHPDQPQRQRRRRPPAGHRRRLEAVSPVV